jgi:hypothetical protein
MPDINRSAFAWRIVAISSRTMRGYMNECIHAQTPIL